MTYQAGFTNPLTHYTDSYLRRGQEFPLPATVTFACGAAWAKATVKLIGRNDAGEFVAASKDVTPASPSWTHGFTQFRGVLFATVDSGAAVLPVSVSCGTPPASYWVPLVEQNFKNDGIEGNARGWDWVKWTGAGEPSRDPLPALRPLAKFNFAPYTDTAKATTYQDCILDDMCGEYDFPSRSWGVLPNGWMCTSRDEPYFPDERKALNMGDAYDGPRGAVSNPVRVIPDPSPDWYIVAGNATGLHRVHRSGTVQTILGWRRKGPRPHGYDVTVWFNVDYAKRDAYFQSFYEFVGTAEPNAVPNGIFDMVLDPRNPDHLYYVNTDANTVCRLVISTKTATVVVPPGTLQLPRGITFDPAGDAMRVTSDRGCAVYKLLRDGTLTVVVQSGGMSMMPGMLGQQADMIRPMMNPKATGVDVPFASAIFMHPISPRYSSAGKLRISCHHEMAIREIDEAAGTIRLLTNLYPANHPDANTMLLTWPMMEVDSTGAIGPVDQMYLAHWVQDSDRTYKSDGSAMPWGQTNWSGPSRSNGPHLDFGPLHQCEHRGYPWCIGIDPRGALVHSGMVGNGLFLIRKRVAEDGPDVDVAKFTRGEMFYAQGKPPLKWLHGRRGTGRLVDTFEQFDDLTDAQIATLVRTTWGKAATDAQIADFAYYLRAVCQCCKTPNAGTPLPSPPPKTDAQKLAELWTAGLAHGWVTQ